MVKWKPTTMSVHHMSYTWSFFLFSWILFILEPACKKSCQPIADKLSDIQAAKYTAEQPHDPTVPTQPLEAEHSAPSQFSSPYNRTVSTNKLYFSQENIWQTDIAHFKQDGSLTFPGFILMRKATLWCVSFASNRIKNWICALLEIKNGFSFRTDFPTGRRIWY